jgi:hypothetical protein
MPGSYGSLVKAAERLSLPAEIAAPSHIKTPAKLWLAASHAVPSMESLGLARQCTPFAGGESEGLARLNRSLALLKDLCALVVWCRVTLSQVHRPRELGRSF